MRLTARPDLHERVEDAMALADLMKLSDCLVQLTLNACGVCRSDHSQCIILLILSLSLVGMDPGHDLPGSLAHEPTEDLSASIRRILLFRLRVKVA